MKRITLILALIISTTAFAQVDTETHRFWQPGVLLTFDDFQGSVPDSANFKKMSDLHIYHNISTGFWSALDIPKSKRKWKKGLQEKYYFCAAMEKSTSFFIVRDSTELKYAQLIWDICELSTRISRRNLAQFLSQINEDESIKVNGAISIQYMTCVNDGKQFGREATHAFFDEVVTTHDEQAYQKFRRQIDELLDELSEYATTEAEIRRLTSDQPDKGYILAPSLMGDFKERGEIRY